MTNRCVLAIVVLTFSGVFGVSCSRSSTNTGPPATPTGSDSEVQDQDEEPPDESPLSQKAPETQLTKLLGGRLIVELPIGELRGPEKINQPSPPSCSSRTLRTEKGILQIDSFELYSTSSGDFEAGVKAEITAHPPRLPEGVNPPQWRFVTVTKVKAPLQVVAVSSDTIRHDQGCGVYGEPSFTIAALYVRDGDGMVLRLNVGISVPWEEGQPPRQPTKEEKAWAEEQIEPMASSLRQGSMKIDRAAGNRRLWLGQKLAIDFTVPTDWVTTFHQGDSSDSYSVIPLRKLGGPLPGGLSIFSHGCIIAEPEKGPFVRGKLLGRDIRWEKLTTTSGLNGLDYTQRIRADENGTMVDVWCHFYTVSGQDQAELDQAVEIAATSRVALGCITDQDGSVGICDSEQ